MHNNTVDSFLNNLLLFLIFCFPLFVIFGNAAMNISTVAISMIILFKFLNGMKFQLLNNSLLIYLTSLILFIFVNSIFKIDSFELFFKLIGYFRYLFLAIGVYIVLENINKKQISFFLNFNLILILLVGLDIIYQ